MKHYSRYILVAICAAGLIARAAAEEAITEEELVRRAQELFDAVVPGDKAPWQKYWADDCMFFDEKGQQMDKTALVADIAPLPAGYSGTIKVVRPKSHIEKNVAILSYDCDETETIFGQNLTARYHQTDTWLRRNGVWQIVAAQTLRYYEDPAAGKAEPKRWADFVGTYELAPGQTRVVSAEEGKLTIERKGKREELLTESGDLFFRKGIEGRILFRANNEGKIDTLIDRRNNEDVVWRKVK